MRSTSDPIEIAFSAHFQDGNLARLRPIRVRVAGKDAEGALIVIDPANGRELAQWPTADVFTVPSRRDTIRIGREGAPAGARIIVEDPSAVAVVRAALPGLGRKRNADKRRQMGLIGLSSAALVAFVAAYLVGVPLLAGRVVSVISPAWETQVGETVAEQVAEIFEAQGGFEICDPDPDSPGNRALSSFADRVLQGVESPFDVRIAVVRSEVANAIALPGGRIYYFSALLDETRTPEEFAGVLAHEIGHVVHRHSMEQLVASAGTGLLVGFVLGDVTGLSVAGALGVMLVDSNFSRRHELEADRFARLAAERMQFDVSGLADLLDRVTGEDAFAEALALLSTHPLTEDRRAALAARTPVPPRVPALTSAQWQAITEMCGGPVPAGAD
ncbi:M48 family metallopeptidase [Pelagibacterium montanilacus]|uniref:M48 family metallopeptidase n=1 Tax=Pelagibacterium montanilacus TaxID=2185280 RepID=UPI0013DF5383|nr:M48 family metallopeptidase [Pelagibacterium montanilacus]